MPWNWPRQPPVPIAHAGKRKQPGNGLMSLLPAPKNTLPAPVSIAIPPTSITTKAAVAGSVTETRPFKVAKLQAGETTVRSIKPAPVAHVDDKDKDDEDDTLVLDGGVDIISQIRNNAAAQSSNMFSFVSTSPAGNASSASSGATESIFEDEPPEILHLKPQLSAFGGVANLHAYTQPSNSSSSSGSSSSGSSGSGNGSGSSIAHYTQQSYPHQQSHSEYAQYSKQAGVGEEYHPDVGSYGSYEGGNEGDNDGGNEGDFEGAQGTSRADRRRRERDIEQHLINGEYSSQNDCEQLLHDFLSL